MQKMKNDIINNFKQLVAARRDGLQLPALINERRSKAVKYKLKNTPPAVADYCTALLNIGDWHRQ